MLFLHFEDLKANPGREIGKLAKFVGVDLNEEQLNHIVDDTSFENMKKRPLVTKKKIAFKNFKL